MIARLGKPCFLRIDLIKDIFDDKKINLLCFCFGEQIATNPLYFIPNKLRRAKPAISVDKCVIAAHALLCFNPVFISLIYILFIHHEVNLDS